MKKRMLVNKDLLKQIKKQPYDYYEPCSDELIEKYKGANFKNLDYANPKDQYMESLNPANELSVNEPKILSVKNLTNIQWMKDHHEMLFESIIIHFHGGAFIGESSGSVMHYVFPWVKEQDIPVFSLDYRLAPYAQYPQIVNDGINAYLWILYFITCILRVKVKNIILTGDSAGGTLAIQVTNWLITNKIRKPDYLFTHSPAINCNPTSYSPSIFMAMDNPVLNYMTLTMASDFYFPKCIDANSDCFANILGTPQWIQENYPKTEIGIADLDPLRDDAYRFCQLLLRIDKSLIIYLSRHSPHDPILGYSKKSDAPPEANFYNNVVIDRFKSWIGARFSNLNENSERGTDFFDILPVKKESRLRCATYLPKDNIDAFMKDLNLQTNNKTCLEQKKSARQLECYKECFKPDDSIDIRDAETTKGETFMNKRRSNSARVHIDFMYLSKQL